MTVLALAALLAGCSSPDYVLTKTGPAKTDLVKFDANNEPVLATPDMGGQLELFALAYASALKEAIKEARGDAAANGVDRPKLYRQMAVEGYGAVYANCSEYFSSGGENERTLAILRDGATIATAIAAGVLAITGPGATSIASLGLASITAHSVLDSYNKNFLFAAENISNVRILILNALNEHRDKELSDPSPFTFSDAVVSVLDNQEICRPSDIVRLVKIAIEKGQVKAYTPGVSTDAAVNHADLVQLMTIAARLDYPGGAIPPRNVIASLYWFYVIGASSTEEQEFLKGAMTGLRKSPFTQDGVAGQEAMTQNDVAIVSNALNQLSSTKKAELEAQITAWKQTLAANRDLGPAGAPPSALGANPPLTPISDEPAGIRRRHAVTIE